MPQDDDDASNRLAVIPYNIHLAFGNLSLKRKFECYDREETSSRKVRGIVEEGCQKKELIFGPALGNDPVEVNCGSIGTDLQNSEGKRLIKNRKIRKWKGKAKMGKEWNEEADLVNVNVILADEVPTKGCGGWPLAATRGQ